MPLSELNPPTPKWGIRFDRPNLKTGLPLRTLMPAGQYIVPLVQKDGSAAEPLLAPGATVLKGQPLVALPTGGQGAAIHAPTSGRVSAIEQHSVPGTGMQRCIFIEADGADQAWSGITPVRNPLDDSPAMLLDAIAAAGIVGLGGAMFPTATKLDPGSRIHTLVLNGVECEPRINCDDGLIRDRAAEILAGGRIMLHILGAERCIVAVKADTEAAIECLRAAFAELNDARFTLALVPPVYPAGGERQLLQILTGQEIPTGGLPRDIGCICQNVATAAAVQRFISTGEPLISRIVTITGSGVANAINVEARLGTPIRRLIEFAGGYTTDAVQLIMGGPMMGLPIADDSAPLTKATNCIYVHAQQESAAPSAELACIRCGDCATVCPVALAPQLLLNAQRGDDFELLLDLGLADCIECGCCDYVCPSNIELTSRFRRAKHAQREIEFERLRAVTAEERFAARTKRLEREADELRAQSEATDGAGNKAEALQRLLERIKKNDDRQKRE
jgi:electron transport complex protein RnfC